MNNWEYLHAIMYTMGSKLSHTLEYLTKRASVKDDFVSNPDPDVAAFESTQQHCQPRGVIRLSGFG